MKKLLCVLLAAVMAVMLFAGCAGANANKTPVNVAALKGPTGMGMAVIMGDEFKEKYNIALSAAPDDVSAKLISGEVDIAAVPLNLASVLYNKTEGQIVMLAVNTLGVLYILENGDSIQTIDDLAGKTLYATGQGSTPEYMLNYLLAQ
ncbi:MAG TPA: ABC transporter substrate-binding protein, partial [Clostridia bacterium]|nr:ABC transporter substrate-binding protein [Clostridia bacterium]